MKPSPVNDAATQPVTPTQQNVSSAAGRPCPTLDARLAAAAAYVRPGCVCADIGCDHGKLSVQLSTQGTCSRIIACDVRPAPLARARHNLTVHGCANVECRLGDGLSVLRPDEVDDIVIAGLSGVTISDILAAASAFWQPRYRFIFVPASKPETLRRWLWKNGFDVLAETAALAAGRVYTVMHAQYTGAAYAPTALDCLVGRLGTRTPAETAYRAKVAGQLRKVGNEKLAKEVEKA